MQNKSSSVNGVDVDRLVETIDHIEHDSDLASFSFCVHNEWVDGAHSQTTIQEFYGAGEERTRSEPFVLDGDEPPVILGKNRGPNAVEAALHALAACLATGFAYNAAAQGIEIRSLEMDIEGDLDLHGFLGLSDDVRPGYHNVQVNYRVKTDASEDEVVELCDYVQKTSPVLDIFQNSVAVSVSAEQIN